MHVKIWLETNKNALSGYKRQFSDVFSNAPWWKSMIEKYFWFGALRHQKFYTKTHKMNYLKTGFKLIRMIRIIRTIQGIIWMSSEIPPGGGL